MIKFQGVIKGKNIRMYSNVPLKNAGTAVLKTLNAVASKVDIFKPGFILNYGWSSFFLDKRKDNDGKDIYVVQTVDYENNIEMRTDNCGLSLVVQNMQMNTNFRAKVKKPEPTFYKDKILVLKEAIGAEDVYLNRTDAAKNGDSGWYFGLLNDENEGSHSDDEFIQVPTYELMKFRGEALRVLQMPVGTLAVFHKNEMTALVDENDNPLDFSTRDEREQAIARKAAAESAEKANSAPENEENTDSEKTEE